MSFRDNIKSDALDCFLNKDEFAEKVIYRPYNASEKVIRAVVNRRRQNPAAEVNSRIGVRELEIMISTDPTEGLAVIFRAKDKVIVAELEGGPSYEYKVVDTLASDAGIWHLLLRQ